LEKTYRILTSHQALQAAGWQATSNAQTYKQKRTKIRQRIYSPTSNLQGNPMKPSKLYEALVF
jgi:hypothetical protein